MLDIHNLETGEYICGIDSRRYNDLRRVFDKFKACTGIYIDEYDDTILSIDSIKTLINIIDDYLKTAEPNGASDILEFKELLNAFLSDNIEIKLVGD